MNRHNPIRFAILLFLSVGIASCGNNLTVDNEALTKEESDSLANREQIILDSLGRSGSSDEPAAVGPALSPDKNHDLICCDDACLEEIRLYHMYENPQEAIEDIEKYKLSQTGNSDPEKYKWYADNSDCNDELYIKKGSKSFKFRLWRHSSLFPRTQVKYPVALFKAIHKRQMQPTEYQFFHLSQTDHGHGAPDIIFRIKVGGNNEYYDLSNETKKHTHARDLGHTEAAPKRYDCKNENDQKAIAGNHDISKTEFDAMKKKFWGKTNPKAVEKSWEVLDRMMTPHDCNQKRWKLVADENDIVKKRNIVRF